MTTNGRCGPTARLSDPVVDGLSDSTDAGIPAQLNGSFHSARGATRTYGAGEELRRLRPGAGMHCSRCHADNAVDSAFCTHCGTGLVEHCPTCDAENPLPACFCRRCGAVLSNGATAGPSGVGPQTARNRYSAPEGERRQLTVMFCDLVDSAVLGEQLDLEELHGIVHAYQRSCAAVVERHGGYVAQYAGDGLVVYFGYPLAHENDAERAIDAGVGILDEIAVLNTRLHESRGIRLGLRIGIHSGPVVVAGTGGGDARERQVLGHTVNLAARLQASAEPDSVVTTAATLRLARGLFVTAELGARSLKGMVEPVALHRVLRRTGARTRLEVAAATGLTPFVGRDDDVALLVDRWEQATAGHGQVVLLNGEAGIGKSRLVQVLRERLAAQPCVWLEGHCSPYHEHSPFRPVIELLEQELHLCPDDAPPQRLAALERALAPTGLPLTDAVPLMASLLAVPLPEAYASPALSGNRQRPRTLDTLAAWLLSVSARNRP